MISLLLSIISATISITALYLSIKAYSRSIQTQLDIEGLRAKNGDIIYIEEAQPLNEGEPLENSLVHLDVDDSLEYWREVEEKRRARY